MTFKSMLEEYVTLSVTKCKEMGFFKQGAACSGSVRWRNRDGNETASIGFITDLRNVPFARLVYEYNGVTQDYVIPLRRKQSNLNPANGFYLFVCPVTGLSCRKLYLVNGRFVSRRAFRALYEKQTFSRTEKQGVYKYLILHNDLEWAENQRYRKRTYNGKLTAYGRKLLKMEERLDAMGTDVAQYVRNGGF